MLTRRGRASSRSPRPNSSAIKLAGGQALGQGVAVAAVRAEDDVVGAQMRADAGRDRLLADVGVAGAVDQAALVTARELLLALADQLHGAVQKSASGCCIVGASPSL